MDKYNQLEYAYILSHVKFTGNFGAMIRDVIGCDPVMFGGGGSVVAQYNVTRIWLVGSFLTH